MPIRSMLKPAILFIATGAFAVQAEERPIESFENSPETRWTYVADTVMGGVSRGAVQFGTEGGESFARLKGAVSTDNNGGFIQFRHQLAEPAPAEARGIRLRVRGNGEIYFIHLRSKSNRLPWSYYQAGFETTAEWTEVRLPFSAFTPSGRLMRATINKDSLQSIGVVAFGRDHTAQIDVSDLGYY